MLSSKKPVIKLSPAPAVRVYGAYEHRLVIINIKYHLYRKLMYFQSSLQSLIAQDFEYLQDNVINSI